MYVFQSIEQYIASARSNPMLYGLRTTFVACDAGDVSTDTTKTTAALALVEGGHLFILIGTV